MLVCCAVANNPPDYELADRMALTAPSQVRAIGHPLRTTILQLLHERAATITELAAAVERPKSTVAHHVDVLTRNGLLQVVRTRKVRAIEERFYGRTARMFYVSAEPSSAGIDMPGDFNDFEVAARESATAFERGQLWGFIRHARISQRSGLSVLGPDGRAGGGVRPAAQIRRSHVRVRCRHLPHRPPDPADG